MGDKLYDDLIYESDPAPTLEFPAVKSAETADTPADDPVITMEFTVPGTVDDPTAPDFTESPEDTYDDAEPVRRSPWSVLRRLCAALLTGVTLAVFGFCAGHALAAISADGNAVTLFLLRTLSLGEVRQVSRILSAEPPVLSPDVPVVPDTPLDTVDEPPAPVQVIPAYTTETPYAPDMAEILSRERAIPPLDELYAAYGEGAPVVLILSTHATEGYADTAENGYRTTDEAANVVSVAAVIAEHLESTGIGVIHCRTQFDAEDFTMAYYNASLEIRSQLKEHPSLRYIIDVHRDSVQAADGTYLPMETGDLAQLMFVAGTDHGGSGHTGWEDNFALAARLHRSLESANPGLMRSMNLRSASFNQQYTAGSLLVEIGSCAGDHASALRTAAVFGDALAVEILG